MEENKRFYQYLATFTGLLTIVAGGMHYAWPSPSIPQYTSGNSTSFQMTEDEGSWIIIMEIIAPIPCCFIGAIMNNIYGPKKTLLVSGVPYLVGWLLIAFATSIEMLLVARIFAGISDGLAFTVISPYVGEIAEPSIRGFLGAAISATWIFGMLLINVMGSYLSITITALISAVVPLLFLVTFIWMPESPYFLIMKQDIQGAHAALTKLRGTDNVQEELRRLQRAIRYETKEAGNALELFTKKNNRKGLGIVAIIRNSQQLSGVAAISFYTLAIFSEAGDFLSPLASTILYVSLQCLTTCVCSFLIDKTGRRPLLVVSLIGSSICLSIEGSYYYLRDFTDVDINMFNYVPVLALIGFVIIFNLGAQPIPQLVQGELFSTNVKGLACCFSEVYFCILASITSKFFQIMRDDFGMCVPFFGFACCCVVNLIFVIIFLPETKGKTLEEIQDGLRGFLSKEVELEI